MIINTVSRSEVDSQASRFTFDLDWQYYIRNGTWITVIYENADNEKTIKLILVSSN